MVGVILMASGFSRRMGENKLLLKINGRTMAQRALEVIPKSCPAVLVTRFAELENMARARGIKTVHNAFAGEGVSASIKLGIEALPGMTGYMFCVCDQPGLTEETVRRLIDAFEAEPECIWAASCGGKRGNPAIFPAALKGDLLSLEGDSGGRIVINAHPEMLKTVETAASELIDIDSPEALLEYDDMK